MTDVHPSERRHVLGPVVGEVIDGDLVVLAMHTGHYFSGNDAAAVLWPLIASGASEAALRDGLISAYAIASAQAGDDAARFLRQLVAAGILVPGNDPGAVTDAGQPPTVGVPAANGRYAAPALEEFDDLDDLLLLDPIHDVSEQGWPHRADDAAPR